MNKRKNQQILNFILEFNGNMTAKIVKNIFFNFINKGFAN